MARYQDQPIREKLNRVILTTCSIVLLLACGALAAYEAFDFRRTLVRDMGVLADVVASNSQASLLFKDEADTTRTLGALQAEPYLENACAYMTNGIVLAFYIRPGTPRDFPDAPEVDGYRFEKGRLLLYRPVMFEERRVGTIRLQAGLQGLHQRLIVSGTIGGLVLIGSLLVAFILSSRLQRPISEPLLALAATAKAISVRKDYSVRAAPGGRDEIGVLTEAFNKMLSVIDERERALRTGNEKLLAEIAERRVAEGRVQAQVARHELLNQITRAIGERQDLRSVFQVVVGSLEEHLDVAFSCILLHNLPTGDLTVCVVGKCSTDLAAAAGLNEKIVVPVDANGLSRCVQGQLVYEPDIGQVPFPFPERLAKVGLRSLVIAPLLVESQIFGVAVVARREPNAFSSGECEFLRQLSEHVALAAHQAQLNAALQQAYDELRQTQQAVMQQERLRALGQMASGIAHDINNAISPVALYTESLLENEPGLSDRARNYLGTIQRAIEDVAQTVARMREFYRQREPQMMLVPVQLNVLVQQVLELSRARWSDMPQQRGHVIQLATELMPELPAVMGVESELREALINLVFNAVDAMPDGGTLTLRTLLREGGLHGVALVEVADTGIGMDEDTRRRCLEPFFTTKGERGTGLGLAMVYGTLRRHGADLEMISAPGRGTTVRVSFSVPGPAAKNMGSGIPSLPVPSRLRLLTVDDDPVLLKTLRDILETDGHQVATAGGGADGVALFVKNLASKEPFDVVITDLGMPHFDGRRVAASVKAASPATPVIMLTGWGQRMALDGEIPPHVDQVLGKPPKLRELRDALALCLSAGSSETTPLRNEKNAP